MQSLLGLTLQREPHITLVFSFTLVLIALASLSRWTHSVRWRNRRSSRICGNRSVKLILYGAVPIIFLVTFSTISSSSSLTHRVFHHHIESSFSSVLPSAFSSCIKSQVAIPSDDIFPGIFFFPMTYLVNLINIANYERKEKEFEQLNS